jgi:hypothetical protein
MADSVTIQVGDKNYAIQPDHLPPVGTRITAHKHLYDGGTYPLLEVVGHEWRLEEAPEENLDENEGLFPLCRMIFIKAGCGCRMRSSRREASSGLRTRPTEGVSTAKHFN